MLLDQKVPVDQLGSRALPVRPVYLETEANLDSLDNKVYRGNVVLFSTMSHCLSLNLFMSIYELMHIQFFINPISAQAKPGHGDNLDQLDLLALVGPQVREDHGVNKENGVSLVA